MYWLKPGFLGDPWYDGEWKTCRRERAASPPDGLIASISLPKIMASINFARQTGTKAA
jgi:hypothetical protein